MIRALQNSDEIGDFDFVEVNGMRISEPAQVFVEIHRQLTGEKRVGASSALRRLNRIFQCPNLDKRPLVLFVDEVRGACRRNSSTGDSVSVLFADGPAVHAAPTSSLSAIRLGHRGQGSAEHFSRRQHFGSAGTVARASRLQQTGP